MSNSTSTETIIFIDNGYIPDNHEAQRVTIVTQPVQSTWSRFQRIVNTVFGTNTGGDSVQFDSSNCMA